MQEESICDTDSRCIGRISVFGVWAGWWLRIEYSGELFMMAILNLRIVWQRISWAYELKRTTEGQCILFPASIHMSTGAVLLILMA
jgi:hypothetical protein